MNATKKILALLLVAAMCLMLLAACSGSNSNKDNGDSGNQGGEPADTGDQGNAPADTGDQGGNAPADDGGDMEEEEMAEITMAYFDVMSNGEKADHVVAAINEITEPEYNLHIDIAYWPIADYVTQLSLAASTQDLPDILGGFPMLPVASMQSQGELMDIAPYLDSEDAQGFMNVVGDYLGAFTINGGVYGIPTYRIYTTQYYIIMRQDILEELGMVDKAQNMSTWAEYDEILEAVYDNYMSANIYPVSKGTGKGVFANCDVCWTSIPQGGSFDDNILYDKLSDTLLFFSADTATNTYTNMVDNEYYIDACKKAAEWYEKGWLYPDGPFSEDHCDTLMKQGVQFSDFQPSEVGIEASKLNATGYQVVCKQINDGMVKTSDLNTWGVGLSTNCDDVEASLRFISAMYTDSRIMNLLDWGVEGTDYVVLDSGEAGYGDLDPASVYHSGDWIHGNQFLTLPWEGQGGDFRTVSMEINNEATNSPYLGLAIDLSAVDQEVAAISAVGNEYFGQIAGGLYTEELCAEFADKLEDAGASTYIATYQEQLDAWLAAQ